ncbi:hypothetical protein ABZ858_24695 [Streptomyces sp. NPDC047017]|uniref:hypothetical protein n=1 Tax=Streptomyces sp. NPDC047017 TaxID=3155024 RepID=UPI0033D86298
MRGLGFGSLRDVDPDEPPARPDLPADGSVTDFRLTVVRTSDHAHRHGVRDPRDTAEKGWTLPHTRRSPASRPPPTRGARTATASPSTAASDVPAEILRSRP